MDAAGGCLESQPGVNSKERDTAGVVVYRKHLLQSLTLSHHKVPPQEQESKCWMQSAVCRTWATSFRSE